MKGVVECYIESFFRKFVQTT